MGDDTSLIQAARVSYGAGTKSVREDRGLIRYLFRHQHTSPIEMAEIKFHIKLPIFVMRQLIRHRTASTNEISARYSVMNDEFYIPDANVILPQSDDNKQGRAGNMSEKNKRGVQWMFTALYETAYDCYQALLGERDKTKFIQGDIPYGAYDEDDSIFDNEFSGTARELSRSVLPVGNYTEAYWKIDLSNLLKLLKLRLDPHAQYEIRVYAEAMYNLIKPIFPLSCEAAEDYSFQAKNLSRMEVNLVKDSFQNCEGFKGVFEDFGNDEAALGKHYGLSKREIIEFREGFGV
jgi:thymidylate synthase (FAD)